MFLENVDHADFGFPRRKRLARGADHDEADDSLALHGDEHLLVQVLAARCDRAWRASAPVRRF
jgi:hypothetical protein